MDSKVVLDNGLSFANLDIKMQTNWILVYEKWLFDLDLWFWLFGLGSNLDIKWISGYGFERS